MNLCLQSLVTTTSRRSQCIIDLGPCVRWWKERDYAVHVWALGGDIWMPSAQLFFSVRDPSLVRLYRSLSLGLSPSLRYGTNRHYSKTAHLSTAARHPSQQPCTAGIWAGAYFEACSTVFRAGEDRSSNPDPTASRRSLSTRQDRRSIRRKAASCGQGLEARVQDRQWDVNIIGVRLDLDIHWQQSACSWDAKAYEYKIAESSNPVNRLNDLDQYVFVVRQRVDKYVDIY